MDHAARVGPADRPAIPSAHLDLHSAGEVTTIGTTASPVWGNPYAVATDVAGYIYGFNYHYQVLMKIA